MNFHANYVTTSVFGDGDYYQATFEAEQDTDDPDSPYLLIQRQFEDPDDNRCYIEMHDEKYCSGNCRARVPRHSLTPSRRQPRTSTQHEQPERQHPRSKPQSSYALAPARPHPLRLVEHDADKAQHQQRREAERYAAEHVHRRDGMTDRCWFGCAAQSGNIRNYPANRCAEHRADRAYRGQGGSSAAMFVGGHTVHGAGD